MIRQKLFILISFIFGWTTLNAVQPNPYTQQADTTLLLNDISVTTQVRRPTFIVNTNGTIELSSQFTADNPTFMNSADPVAIIRTLPSVSTCSDLQAAFSVMGSTTGSNLFLADGMRIINPFHMLGFFSAFNPSYYKTLTFNASRINVLSANTTAGRLEAISSANNFDNPHGEISLGAIESHTAISIPIKPIKSIASVGFRKSYLHLLFPSILQFGRTNLKYGFSDLNIGLTTRFTPNNSLSFNFLAGKDHMKFQDLNSMRDDGAFGWENLSVGASWKNGKTILNAAYSGFFNRFKLSEANQKINLPSKLSQISLSYIRPIKTFTIEADAAYRYSSGQQNIENTTNNSTDNRAKKSFEFNAALLWNKTFVDKLGIELGARVSYYHQNEYNIIVPQLRLHTHYNITDNISFFAAYGRYVRFDRLVEETTGGLPANFWTCADKTLPPETSDAFNVGINIFIPDIAIHVSVEGYYKIIKNSGEFNGSILNTLSADYNALSDVILGDGYAGGITFLLTRNFGKIRGRLSYTFGVSKLKFAELGKQYVSAAGERPHDLNLTLTYQATEALNFSAAFTYASGLPYTRAKYGYMIGENLICEYYPHNSSRLPAYKRLDFSATYTFPTNNSRNHSIGISVYNALATNNILFYYTTYSFNEGIKQRKSVMKSVIPSINYTFKF